MNRTFRLFTVIGQAAFLFTGAGFLLAVVSFLLLVPPSVRSGPLPRTPSVGEAITLIVVLVGPPALGFWWIFRKLRAEYPRRQALGAAIAFAVFSPVPLTIGLLLSPIVGGYASIFLGTDSGMVFFLACVLEIVAMIVVMTFIPSLLALWITRHMGGEVHQTQ